MNESTTILLNISIHFLRIIGEYHDWLCYKSVYHIDFVTQSWYSRAAMDVTWRHLCNECTVSCHWSSNICLGTSSGVKGMVGEEPAMSQILVQMSEDLHYRTFHLCQLLPKNSGNSYVVALLRLLFYKVTVCFRKLPVDCGLSVLILTLFLHNIQHLEYFILHCLYYSDCC